MTATAVKKPSIFHKTKRTAKDVSIRVGNDWLYCDEGHLHPEAVINSTTFAMVLGGIADAKFVRKFDLIECPAGVVMVTTMEREIGVIREFYTDTARHYAATVRNYEADIGKWKRVDN